MVSPIRFGKSGPTPRLKVQKVKDIDEVRNQLDSEIEANISIIGELTDSDSNKEDEQSQLEDNHEQLQATELKVSLMMDTFNQVISECEICESLGSDKHELVQEKIADLKEHTSAVRRIASRKFAFARAKILIKSFWNKQSKMSTPLSSDNREHIEAFFKNGKFSDESQTFQNTLRTINQSLDAVNDLIGSELHLAMIKKGELLEAKEDLITAYIEYKRAIALRYQEVHGESSTPDVLSPSLRDRILETFSTLKGDKDLLEKIMDVALTNRYSDPVSLLKDSLSLSIIVSSSKNTLSVNALSISRSTLSLGFAVPISILSAIKLIRNRAKRRKIVAAIDDAKSIRTFGDLMHDEGLNLHQTTSNSLLENIKEKSDLGKLGASIKRADRLTSLGVELKEKATLTRQELEEELSSVNFSLFNSIISTPLGLASLASTSLSIASRFIQNPAVRMGLQTMTYIGIASGAIGIVLGSVGILKKAQIIHETRVKLSKLNKKNYALRDLEMKFRDDPLVKEFCAMEKTLLLNERNTLIVELRSYWIEIANSILLTIGGAIAFTAFITGAAATAGIGIAVIAIIAISTVLVFTHHYKKQEWEIEKKPIDPTKLLKLRGDFDAISHYLKLADQSRIHYNQEPKAVLKLHFNQG